MLSDQQVAAIRAFVAQGGGLVATGSSASMTNGCAHAAFRACGFVARAEARTCLRRGSALVASSGVTTQKEYERGRAAYIPGLQFDGPLPEPRPYFEIDNRFWKNPKNAGQFLDAVRWPPGTRFQ